MTDPAPCVVRAVDPSRVASIPPEARQQLRPTHCHGCGDFVYVWASVYAAAYQVATDTGGLLYVLCHSCLTQAMAAADAGVNVYNVPDPQLRAVFRRQQLENN